LVLNNCTSENVHVAAPEIIIVTHGKFGEELIRSVEMILGEVEGVHFLPLLFGDDVDTYRAHLKALIKSVPQGSILLADLFGGTPSNSVLILSEEAPIPALAGLNMGMLLEALTMRTEYAGKELIEAVKNAGLASIMDIEL